MNNHITKSDFAEGLNSIRDTIQEKKRNLWWVDGDIRKKYGLSWTEATFLCMIIQLQCVQEGNCKAKNYYFIDNLGISDRWIDRALKKLASLNLIWTHYYHTKNGKRRQIVTSDSVLTYQKFLKKHKSWATLKKFQEEFVLVDGLPVVGINNFKGRTKLSSPTVKATDNKSVKFNREEVHRASAKMTLAPPAKMADAINTTYLPYKKNSVTCKGLKEKTSAVFLKSLKEELVKAFPASEIDIGMQWYEMQSDLQKHNMKKPIACIVKALKDGYAHEQVSSKNAEVKNKLEAEKAQIAEKIKKKQTKEDLLIKKRDLANKIIKEFSGKEGWKHSLTDHAFWVENTTLKIEKGPYEHSTSQTMMPDGSVINYRPAARGLFKEDESLKNFKSDLNFFFRKNLWIDKEADIEDIVECGETNKKNTCAS